MHTTTTHQIHEVGTIFVPVSDQERALDFYTRVLGFEKRADFSYGGGQRWIEVAPLGAANTISLVAPGEGASDGTPQAHCAFLTADIEALHSNLLEAGITVDPEIAHAGCSRPGLISPAATIENPQPRQFLFSDPDGNRFLIVQPD